MDAIRNRRSVRNYQDNNVSEEVIERVLEAVRWSPSWANTQCWEIVVVRDPAVKLKLQESLLKGNPASRSIVEAPVVLAVCGRLHAAGYYKGQVTTKFGDWFMFDLGIATQSLCLAAYDEGLGTVIVGLLDHAKAGEALQAPSGYEVVALIPIGYPVKSAPTPNRRKISEFIHHDRF
jgi:nitroreductase